MTTIVKEKAKKTINPECGLRLDKILKENNILQKALAAEASYAEPYINQIIKGKRRMSTEAAKRFSKALKINHRVLVSEEYLLCDSDYMTNEEEVDAEFEAISKKIEEKGAALNTLLRQSGFSLKGCYILNWNEIKGNIRGQSYNSIEDVMNKHGESILGDLRKAEYIFELETPDHGIINVRNYSFSARLNAIDNFVKFMMENLFIESLNDKTLRFPKPEGSEIPNAFDSTSRTRYKIV